MKYVYIIIAAFVFSLGLLMVITSIPVDAGHGKITCRNGVLDYGYKYHNHILSPLVRETSITLSGKVNDKAFRETIVVSGKTVLEVKHKINYDGSDDGLRIFHDGIELSHVKFID